MKGIVLFMASHFLLSYNLVASFSCEKDTLDYLQKRNSASSYLNIFDGGNIGVLSNGNLRSSTNILRFNVGNKRKFYLPFYLNVGANINLNVAGQIVNENAAFNLLNDMGGLVNFGVNGKIKIKAKSRSTQFFTTYHLALKSINGIGREDALAERFLSKVLSLGFIIKSKAWNPNNPKGDGYFWVKNSMSISDNPSQSVEKIFGEEVNDIFLSHSLEAGIHINGGMDINFSLYHFINNKSVILIDSPIMKLGTNVQF